VSDQDSRGREHLERPIGRITLRCRWGTYAAEHLDELAAQAGPITAYVDSRLRPLAGTGRRLRRLIVNLQGTGDGTTTSEDVVVPVGRESSGREFLQRLALAMVRARLGGPDVWRSPVGQADAAAIGHALEFLALGLARYLAAEAEQRQAHLFANTRDGDAPRQSADQVCRQVAADRDGKVPLYESLVGGPNVAATPPEYAALAESFCGYLFEREGAKAYRRFVIRSGESPNAAADLVYGKTLEELQQEWMGAILRGQGRQPVSLKTFAVQVVPYLRPYSWLVVLALMLMFLNVGVAQVSPFVVRDLIDIISGQAAKEDPNAALAGLYTKLAVLALAAFVSLATITWMVYVVNVVGQNILRDLRVRLTERLHHLSAGFYARRRMGDMIVRFTSDIPRLADPLVEAASQSVYHLIFVIATIGSMLFMSWQLSLLLFLILPVYVVAARKLGRSIQVASRTRQERLSQLNANLEEMLFGHSLVKTYNLGGHLMKRFRPKIGEFRKVAIWTDFLRSIYREVLGTLDNVHTKLVFGLGGTLVVLGQMTTGTLIGFNTLMSRFMRPLISLMSIYAIIAQASASLRRIEEILREPMEGMDTPPGGSYAPEGVREAITFENVGFSYTGAEPTLIDINLRIAAGSSVAFVGPTGAGKTTLVNLIPRFYDVDSGSVKIDGQDIRSFSLGGLRQTISIVSQDTFVFNSTIMENIRLGRLDASDDEVIEAAKGARLHDFVETLPAGYDALVGERGWRLSGGQRQRVAIARALLRNSPILILDEATSSLDAETESEILAELDEVTQGKTVISITHRLGLAIKSEKICVLQAGRIVQQGSHEELIRTPGLYAKLFEDQNRDLMRRAAGDQPTVGQALSLPSFRMVQSSEVASLAELLKTERYAAGEVFCQQNGSNGRLYLLRSGEVELTVHDEHGLEQRLYVGAPNGGNGVTASLLLDIPLWVSGKALTDTELQVLHEDDLRQAIGPAWQRPFHPRVIDGKRD
jgi:ABC-type multidrug transport system fused ATPase/permease subunit